MIKNLEWWEKCPEAHHNDKEICGFFGEYRFLSNYHIAPVMYEGLLYPHTEAAYQAAKSEDVEKRKLFLSLTPANAKNLGKGLPLREGWEGMKDQVMYDVCLDKFTRHKNLEEKLLETGDRRLEETNWWGDCYWGVCGHTGHNKLGETLMKVRDEISRRRDSESGSV